MTTTTEQLILSEIKEFRADVTAWQIASEGRLSALEYATKTGITGNGQPSRLQMVERSVEQFGRFKYWLLDSLGQSRRSPTMYYRVGSIERVEQLGNVPTGWLDPWMTIRRLISAKCRLQLSIRFDCHEASLQALNSEL